MMNDDQIKAGCLHGAMTLAVFFIGMAVMFGLTRCGHEEPKPIVLHDTISVHDTLRITQHTKPREVIRFWKICRTYKNIKAIILKTEERSITWQSLQRETA